VSDDYADRFCELFDRLDAAEFHAEGEAWMADAEVASTAARVEQAVLGGEPAPATAGVRPSPSCSASTPPSPTPTRCWAQPLRLP
jgi:hypothetical protein